MSFRVDHRFSDKHSFYARYLFSDGEVDTPDRTVTARRVRANQHHAAAARAVAFAAHELRRQRAFEFKADVDSGAYPAADKVVELDDEEYAAFIAKLG